MKVGHVLAVAVLASSCDRGPEPKPEAPAPRPVKAAGSYTPEFRNIWGDGHTEVSRYDLTIRGNNDSRKGTAVALFTIRHFSNSRRVEVERSGGDVFPVMKMNWIRQAGPERRDMISVFAALQPVNDLPTGTPLKISFSRQTQEGHEWGQLLMHRRTATHVWHSFRDSEADGHRLLPFRPDASVPEDALPLCARRIAHPVLRLGQVLDARVITTLGNLPIDTAAVRLSLSQERRTTVVPAGSFRTHTFTARWKSGAEKIWEVETEPPHRIIRWKTTGGETGELTGTGSVAGGLQK